jgi:hypothetical protein
MTEQELSENLAKAYGVPEKREAFNGLTLDTYYLWLIKDTTRIMELAFEHDIYYEINENAIMAVDKLNNQVVVEMFSAHPTKKDAILWAVGLALLKKAEGSKA